MKTVSFRMPAALKQEIDAAAETEGISVNSWLMRCAERGVRDAKAQYSHQPSTKRDQREATRASIQASMTNKFSDMG
jgi:hypothetical protein